MKTNDEFRKAFEAEELKSLREKWRADMEEANAEWNKMTRAEQRRRQPRRRKNFDPLPDEFLEPLREQLTAKYNLDEQRERIQSLEANREDDLDRLGDGVQFEPDPSAMYLLDVVSTSSYSSQGYGAKKYARAAVAPLAFKLQQLGFAVYTVYRTRWSNPGGPSYSIREGGDVQLWANCPPWMADAAKRHITLSDISAAVGRSANLKVLYPSLSHNVLEQHFSGKLAESC